jgi:hypothetical protein
MKHVIPGKDTVIPGKDTVTPGEDTVTPGLTRGPFLTTVITNSENGFRLKAGMTGSLHELI